MNTVNLTTLNNNQHVYYAVATWLLQRHTPMLHWTDDEGTTYDIVFSIPTPIGNAPRGVCIAIVGKGAFVFNITKEHIHQSYVTEKLSLPINTTTDKVTDLINNIVSLLAQKI